MEIITDVSLPCRYPLLTPCLPYPTEVCLSVCVFVCGDVLTFIESVTVIPFPLHPHLFYSSKMLSHGFQIKVSTITLTGSF